MGILGYSDLPQDQMWQHTKVTSMRCTMCSNMNAIVQLIREIWWNTEYDLDPWPQGQTRPCELIGPYRCPMSSSMKKFAQIIQEIWRKEENC